MSAEHNWQEIATAQGHCLLRLQVVVLVLRAWSGSGGLRSAAVTQALEGWIDGGMTGPVPWPDEPAFAHWAARHGLGQVRGSIGHWGAASHTSEAIH